MQFFCDNKPLKQESRLRNSSSAMRLAWYKKESYYFWNDLQNIQKTLKLAAVHEEFGGAGYYQGWQWHDLLKHIRPNLNE